MLDFRNLTFHHLTFVHVRLCLLIPNFVLIGHMEPSYSQKWFSIWRPSTILNLGISEFFSHFRWLGQNLRSHTKFRHFRLFAAEIWRYNDFQKCGRLPCWIYCDVIILCRKTEFNAIDIVLKFWHTSVSYFLIYFNYHVSPFSLKLPIFALIFTYFWKNTGQYEI